jgi:hypothetical protein
MGYLCDGRIQDSHSNQISSGAPSLGSSPSGQSRPRQRYAEGFTCSSAASAPLPLPPTSSALNYEVLGQTLSLLRFCCQLPAYSLELECARASTVRAHRPGRRRPPTLTLTPSTAVPCLPFSLPPTPISYLGSAAAVASLPPSPPSSSSSHLRISASADAQFFCAARVKAAAAASFVAATPAPTPHRQRPTWPPGRVPAAQAPRTCPTAPSPTALTAPTVAPRRRRRPSPLHRTTP